MKKPARKPLVENIEEIFPPMVRVKIEVIRARIEANGNASDLSGVKQEAFEQFDYLYHVTKMDERARGILEGLALATAYASFQPGGYAVFGTHYESREAIMLDREGEKPPTER